MVVVSENERDFVMVVVVVIVMVVIVNGQSGHISGSSLGVAMVGDPGGWWYRCWRYWSSLS